MNALAALPHGQPDMLSTTIEVEMALLGALLIDSTLTEGMADLQSDDFSEPLHGRIFAAIKADHAQGKVANAATLKARFDRDPAMLEAGGTIYLARLSEDMSGLLAPRELAEQIKQGSITRRLASLAQNLLHGTGSGDDPSALMVKATGDLAELSKQVGGKITATPYEWRDPATIPPRHRIFHSWLWRGLMACVIAPGGVGKTTFLAGTALSLASGRSFLGKEVYGGPKRVWIWNLEDDLDELARALQGAAIHYGLTERDVAGRLFLDSAMEGSGLCTASTIDGEFRLIQPVYDGLVSELQRRQIDVLIIDPFISSHEVDENDNGKIDKIAKAWARVAKTAGCAIVLVHHTSKAGAGEVTALSSRGAVALIDASRTTLVLNRMDDMDAQRLGIQADERRRYFRVQADKCNRAPAEAADWYQLVSVDLGNATSELPSDSVGVAEPWRLPDPFDDISVDDLRTVQSRIAERRWRESHQAEDQRAIGTPFVG